MKVTCIAAVSDNWVIGRDGGLPWHLPADLKFFKETTYGGLIISGRKSFENSGLLPGRRHVVLSRQENYCPSGVEVINSLEAALDVGRASHLEEIFVLGGEGVFQRAIEHSLATDLVLTRVHAQVEGDTFFPKFSPQDWAREWHLFRPKDDRNVYDLTFERWIRKT